MNLTQFRRVIELTITDIGTNDVITIKDMAVKFSVDKSLTESGNKAYVEINNLSRDTRIKFDISHL